MTRRRPSFQAPRVTDAVTGRRASQQASLGNVAAKGSKIDRSGRIGPNMGAEFYQDDRGAWHLRVDGVTVILVPGSPPRLAIQRGDDSLRETASGLVARPAMSQIANDEEETGVAGGTLLAVIARLQENKLSSLDADYLQALADIAALQADRPLARGTATLVAGVVEVPLATIADGALVWRQRRALAGTWGLELGIAVSAGVSFTITSLDAAGATETLDESTVDYVVWNPEA